MRDKYGGQALSDQIESASLRNSTVIADPAVLQAAQHSPAQSLLDLIVSSLDDDKAEDIVAIELAGKSEMADHLVIASGRSTRQVGAMAGHLADRLKTEMGRPCRVEGKEACDWVLIDCGDAVVHLFRPEVREFYQLEKMWSAEIATAAR